MAVKCNLLCFGLFARFLYQLHFLHISLVSFLYHFQNACNYEYFKCRRCKKVQLERIDVMLAGEAVGNRDIDFFLSTRIEREMEKFAEH